MSRPKQVITLLDRHPVLVLVVLYAFLILGAIAVLVVIPLLTGGRWVPNGG